ncbi:MAG: hypothetical protein AAFQ63_08835 [Cyanobacteria bacterium J06621_11]
MVTIDFLYEIQRREPVFQRPEFGRTPQALENLTDKNFYGIDSYGRQYNRQQAITTALAMYKDPKYQGIHTWPAGTWEIGKFEWLGISYDKLLVTYLLLTRNQMTRRTSIWQLQADNWTENWTIVFHQATPVQP